MLHKRKKQRMPGDCEITIVIVKTGQANNLKFTLRFMKLSSVAIFM